MTVGCRVLVIPAVHLRLHPWFGRVTTVGRAPRWDPTLYVLEDGGVSGGVPLAVRTSQCVPLSLARKDEK